MKHHVVAAIVRTVLTADELLAIVRAAEPSLGCELREAWKHDDGLRRFYVLLDHRQFPGLEIWTEGWPRVWVALRDSGAGREGLINLSVANETHELHGPLPARPDVDGPRPTP